MVKELIMKLSENKFKNVLYTKIDCPVLLGPPGILFAISLAIFLFARMAVSLEVGYI